MLYLSYSETESNLCMIVSLVAEFPETNTELNFPFSF